SLLRACPIVSALATSRVLLSIRAEHDYPLDPLGLPAVHSSGAVAGSDAGRLFIERASAARSGFELTDRNGPAIARICELLDGLPLAIELAAARIKLFSPDALLTRLNERLELLTGGAKDAHPRHRALRATVDWSYDLLTDEEQSFFRDLAVFSGGATIEAIENVTGADALELLTALVNHSLVRRQESDDDDFRFSMLQTIRDYAIELFAGHPGAGEVRERHARYYLELAERSKVKGELKMEALAPLDDELDNARAALTWWLTRADTDDEAALLGLRLAIALGRYWYTHGQAVEGDEWLDRAIRAAPNAPDDLRAEAFARAASSSSSNAWSKAPSPCSTRLSDCSGRSAIACRRRVVSTASGS
ncbi:MAG: ATP-binding protein, partial [Actinomycetota bacterium]